MSLPNPEHEARAEAAEELLEAVAKASWDAASASWPWDPDDDGVQQAWLDSVSAVLNAYEALRPEAEDGPWEWGIANPNDYTDYGVRDNEAAARESFRRREWGHFPMHLVRRRARRVIPAGPWERVEVDA